MRLLLFEPDFEGEVARVTARRNLQTCYFQHFSVLPQLLHTQTIIAYKSEEWLRGPNSAAKGLMECFNSLFF